MRILAILGTVVVLASAPAAAQAPPRPVVIELLLGQEFFYAGDPLNVQVSVRNVSAEKQENPVRTPLFQAFKVRAAGRAVAAEGEARSAEPARPEELSPGGFYGAVLDLSALYPKLREVGTYEIHWSADGLVSDQLRVTVIPRWDPSKDYRAEVETPQGTIVIDLYEGRSPVAVKAFVDMAHTGLYDGLAFQEVHRDTFIVGGEVPPGETGRRVFEFPQELAPTPLVAGTVALKPLGVAPPTNGSTFMILLRPQPDWTGQVTVLGQVIKGLDVVRAISQVPSTMLDSRPNFRPLERVPIHDVRIVEAPTIDPP